MRRKLFLPPLAALLLLLGCAPEAGPLQMAVLDLDPGTGLYDLRVVEVRTLEDVPALRGEAATPIGSAVIRLDSRRLYDGMSEAAFRAAVLSEPGAPVEAQFVEQDGVLYPSDFHSLSLATAYYHFEKARAYALARGLGAEKLRSTPFYYFPALTEDPAEGQLADNAAWFPMLRSFLLFPHKDLQGIPLSMNQGVIAHEYGHAIFNAEVLNGAWFPDVLQRWCDDPGCSDPHGSLMMGSVEEGFADIWALGVTGDLRFINRSIEPVGDRRDLEFNGSRHCYSSAAWEAEIEQARTRPYQWARYWGSRRYELGTMWASALYHAGLEPGTDLDRVIEALLASYRSTGKASLAHLAATDRRGRTFGSFDSIAQAIVIGAKDEPTAHALCKVLGDRFALDPAALDPRCDGVAPGGDCR